MTVRSRLLALGAMMSLAGAANAQLFWNPPDFSGAPVRGDEPGISLAVPGATPAELDANLIWNMRAGLNVAALQCQFAPTLMTVRNYNDLLRNQGAELGRAYKTLGGYFKRTGGKKATVASSQNALDQLRAYGDIDCGDKTPPTVTTTAPVVDATSTTVADVASSTTIP